MSRINVRITLDFAYEAHSDAMTPERIKRVLSGYCEDLVKQGWANLDGFNENAVELATPVSLGVFTRYEDHTKNQPYQVASRPPKRIYRSPDAPPPYPAAPSTKRKHPR